MEQTAQKGFIISIFSIFCLVLPLWCCIAPAEFLLPENTPLVHIYVFADRSSFCRARVFMITGANLLDYRKNTIQRRSLKNVPQEHLHRFFLVAALLGTPVCVKAGNRAHERKGAFPCDIQ